MACRLLWVMSMSRIRIALALAFVGALVLASSACEHKGCGEALKICRADFGNDPRAPQTQSASTDDLKTALGRLQAKVQWPAETPGNTYARRAIKVERDGVGKTGKRQAGGAEQTAGSNRT
jgi:hypothetical protein